MPTYTFQISKQEFYEKLLQISLSNRNLDFSRIYIDFIASQNNFLGLKQVLNEKDMPLMVSFSQVTDQVYEEVLNEHIQFWREGKIDLSLTRLSNIVEDLVRHEVPHIFLFPSPDSVVQQFEQIISELSLIKLAESQLPLATLQLEIRTRGSKTSTSGSFSKCFCTNRYWNSAQSKKSRFSSKNTLEALSSSVLNACLCPILAKCCPFRSTLVGG
ncbi:hypothetical protein ABWK46_23365 [Peribacillus frigoritolerans]|uniref:hypothetical protein n=1 Tax=Peribacillus frigoritolerans TaxID=450367 RepID=UPI0033923D88